MKRFIVLILALIYFTTSSGMVVNLHYCMGKISSVKVNVLAKNLCGCGKKETKGCCKTEHKVVKISDNHNPSYTNYSFENTFSTVPVTYYFVANSYAVNAQTKQFVNHSPPLINEEIFLRNCVFRI
jgi:CDGSH-type Zn-finger protein